MDQKHRNYELAEARRRIRQRVRALRNERRWTQRELAELLDISQARLSEIERGGGSFTAEQLLLILRLFNVDVSSFEGAAGGDLSELQNALVRLGAGHLRHNPDVQVSEAHRHPSDVARALLWTPARSIVPIHWLRRRSTCSTAVSGPPEPETASGAGRRRSRDAGAL